MKKVMILIIAFTFIVISSSAETRGFAGLNLPFGTELGFMSETDINKVDVLKIFTRGSIIWSPSMDRTGNKNSMLIIGLQPGIRIKILNDNLMFSGGVSANPVFMFPFTGMDFWIGSFVGISARIKKVELGLYGTQIFFKRVLFGNIGWLSLTISKSFP